MLATYFTRPASHGTASWLYACADSVAVTIRSQCLTSDTRANGEHGRTALCIRNGLLIGETHDVLVIVSKTVMNKTVDSVHRGSDDAKTFTVPKSIGTIKMSAFSAAVHL